MNIHKLNDFFGVIAVSLCSASAAISLLIGSNFFAGINIFFAVINGVSIYNKLSSRREELEEGAE